MNNTVNLSQLITRLSKVTGADSNTCRRFLREFFASVTDGLANGEQISIKGIGTFLLSVEPTPDGNPRILFMPDQTLAEEVNRPFSMFEAVELADGIDEADLEPEPETEPELETQASDTQEEITITIDNEPEIQPKTEQPADSGLIQESEPEPTAVTEPVPPAPPLPPEPELTKEPESELTSEPKPEHVIPSFPEDDEDETEQDPDRPLPIPERQNNRHTWLWIVLIGLVIGIGAGLIAGLSVDVTVDPADLMPENSIPQADSIQSDTADTPAQVAQKELSAQTTATQNNTSAEISAPTRQSANETANNNRTENPVYETVSSTNYLSSMARRHYGAQVFWVYIYEANADKLGHPDRIAPGTRLIIPPKSSFPEASSEDEARRMAERKAVEIRARFQR